VQRRAWGGAQGLSGQDVRESAVTKGRRVGTGPEHLPKTGDRRSRRKRGGAISFGGGSTVPRSVGAGPVAQPPRLTEAIPPPCPRSRPDALRARRVAVAFSLGKQRKVTRLQGEKKTFSQDQGLSQALPGEETSFHAKGHVRRHPPRLDSGLRRNDGWFAGPADSGKLGRRVPHALGNPNIRSAMMFR
jgi:hypothetical protein